MTVWTRTFLRESIWLFLQGSGVSPGGSVVKNPSAYTRDMTLIPGSGKYPGGGNSNPLQYSYLENPIDRGAWRATVHGVAELNTTERLSMIIVFN